jgi:hypothetical protein
MAWQPRPTSTSTKNANSDGIRILPKLIYSNKKLETQSRSGLRIAYWVESGSGVDGEEGDLVDLGAEDGELPGGSEVEAAVAGGELCVAGEEGVVSREDHPEGEAVPALDPCVTARLVDAVRVPHRQLREAAGGYGERYSNEQRTRRLGGCHGGRRRDFARRFGGKRTDQAGSSEERPQFLKRGERSWSWLVGDSDSEWWAITCGWAMGHLWVFAGQDGLFDKPVVSGLGF